MGSIRPKPRKGKRTKLGLALERTAKEILAHVKGEKSFPTRRVVLPDVMPISPSSPRTGRQF